MYIFHSTRHLTITLNPGETFTDVTNTKVISSGSAPDFLLHALFHLTITLNGMVTALVDNFTAECRG